MRKTKELEQRIQALEEAVKQLIQEQQEEKERLNPPVMGGRK